MLANIKTFLHMGGYAGYVWSAYGLVFVVLVGNALSSIDWRRSESVVDHMLDAQTTNPADAVSAQTSQPQSNPQVDSASSA